MRPLFICSLPTGEFASYDRVHGTIVYYDNSWRTTKAINIEYNISPKRALYMGGSTTDRFFFSEKDRTLFTTYRNDTIWDITSKVATPAYIFNLKDKLLPDSKQVEYSNGDFKKLAANTANYQKLDMFPIDSKNLLLQRSWSNKKSSLYLHNKKDNAIIKYENTNIYDDLTGGIYLDPSISINNKIICITDAIEILKEIQKTNQKINTIQYTKFKAQIANLTEEDNPVIVILK